MVPYLLSNAAEALELNYSLLVVVVLFVLYHLLMKRMFYRPLFGVLKQREERTSGAMDFAAKTDEERQQLLSKYESSMRQARLEGYELMDSIRKDTEKHQDREIRNVSDEIHQLLADSHEEIRNTLAEQRQILDMETESFARLIADRILSRGSIK